MGNTVLLEFHGQLSEVLHRDRRVGRPVIDEHAALSLAVVLTVRRRKATVEGGEGEHGRTGAGELEHGGTAEAVAHRHAARHVDALPRRLLDCAKHQRPHPGPILVQFARMLALVAVFRGADAGAEQIRGEHVVTQVSEHLGPPYLVVRQTVPVVQDQHEAPRRLRALEPTFVLLAVHAVPHGLSRHHGSAEHAADSGRQTGCPEDISHGRAPVALVVRL